MQPRPSSSEQIDILQFSKLRVEFLKGLNGQLGSESVMQPTIPLDNNFEEKREALWKKNSLSIMMKEVRVAVCKLLLNTWSP